MKFEAINLLLDSIALSSRPLLNVTAPHDEAGATNVQEQPVDNKKGKKGKGKKPPMPY